MFISIHIPKTAGTALGYTFDYGSGRRILYDYKDDYSNAKMDDLAWWMQHKPFMERRFDFIHGHFFYEKYADLFPDGDFLACLRHPVERIISQFNHVIEAANDWQHEAIKEHNMDAADFAAFDGVHDAHARHLQGREIEDYDFVFITENLNASLLAFASQYGLTRLGAFRPGGVAGPESGAGGPVAKVNVRNNKQEVSQATRKKIYNIASEDIDLYKRGCVRASKLIRDARLSR